MDHDRLDESEVDAERDFSSALLVDPDLIFAGPVFGIRWRRKVSLI
jgi:hypothetical protein